MKQIIVVFLFIFSFSILQAQDGDTTDTEQETKLNQDRTETSGSEVDSEISQQDSLGQLHTAVDPDSLSSTKKYKQDPVYNKQFDEHAWRKIIGENDYVEDKSDPLNFSLPSLAWGGIVLKIVVYALITGLVGYLVYYVIKNITFSKKTKKPVNSGQYSAHNLEDIRELDIASLLKQALVEKDFKLAIRLYYLLVLKNLDDAGLIKWEKDKTNRDYLSELFSQQKYYDEVRKLTRDYEEVWYGEHTFPDESLLRMIARFESVNEKLNPVKNL